MYSILYMYMWVTCEHLQIAHLHCKSLVLICKLAAERHCTTDAEVVLVPFSCLLCFRSRVVFMCFFFHLCLVPILFIGSSLYVNNFYRIFYLLFLLCFCGGSSTELVNLYIMDDIRMNKMVFETHMECMQVLRFVVLSLLYYWAEFNSNHLHLLVPLFCSCTR